MKKHISIFILTLLSLFGCVREKLDHCEPELLLRYSYILNDDYRDRFGVDVDNVTVYVFDNNNKYVGVFSEHTANLTNNIMRIPLPTGTYNVVVYGGDLSTYTISNIENSTNFNLILNSTNGDNGEFIPTKDPNDLYAGFAKEAISSYGDCKITDIELIRDTKKIKIEVRSDDFISPLDAYIRSANGKYTFENNIDSHYGTFRYLPYKVVAGGKSTYTYLKTMRLVIGTPTEITIVDPSTSKIIYREDLIKLILQHPEYSYQSDLDREDEFVVMICIKKGTSDIGIDISISINGWVINNITPTIE